MEISQSPLDAYETRSVVYARVVLGIALVALLLAGIFETAAFLRISLGPRASTSPIAVALGIIGASSVLLSSWALLRVRTFALWKLALLSLTSMIFLAIGWIGVIAGAH